MKRQWYEIERPNGAIQYATKEEDKGYLLYGSGFYISKLDAVRITPVENVPIVLEKGRAYSDGQFGFKAVCNVNDKWNGWDKPYIHKSHIKTIVREFSWEDMELSLDKNGVLTHKEMDEITTIEPTNIDGELYYYLGDLGWCWEFIKTK